MLEMSPASKNALEVRRKARRAWSLLHLDTTRSVLLADQALAAASGDPSAAAWARLTLGFQRLYFATPLEAAAELQQAQDMFEALGDRSGFLLAGTGLARALWREGRFRESLARVLSLRDEALRVLRPAQRGLLLNTIAGCYSALGRSDQAFAYLYEALREARPRRSQGFDTVLHWPARCTFLDF